MKINKYIYGVLIIAFILVNFIQIQDIKRNIALRQDITDISHRDMQEQLQKTNKRAILNTNRTNANEEQLDILRLTETVRNSISNFPESKFEQAIAIRNHVYQSVNVPINAELQSNTGILLHEFDLRDSYFRFLRDSDNPGSNYVLCSAISAMYTALLEASGIPARGVAMFTSNEGEYKSHQTTEFWFNGRWYASDATFNVMFTSGDEYLSYEEVYNHINKGIDYTSTTNGFPLIENRTLKNYHTSLDDLMKFVVIYPSKIWMDGKFYNYRKTLLPATWDGIINHLQQSKKVDDDLDDFTKYLMEKANR